MRVAALADVHGNAFALAAVLEEVEREAPDLVVPRSDEECVTERTPAERVREFMAGVDANVVVTAHVHLQYDRVVDGLRLLSPGSVGLPNADGGAAYWALLGPDVELRRTEYDVDAAVALMRATDDPIVETIVELMLTPPSRDEVIEDVETRVFAG